MLTPGVYHHVNSQLQYELQVRLDYLPRLINSDVRTQKPNDSIEPSSITGSLYSGRLPFQFLFCPGGYIAGIVQGPAGKSIHALEPSFRHAVLHEAEQIALIQAL